MDLAFKLEKFEGPLDLLLTLIERNKVSIYDIPIAVITDQYLEYVEAMDREDLDIVSEFMLMAATLLDIKARMLLPKDEEEDEETEDPRTELVERLLEYKKYRCISEELRDFEILGEQLQYREEDIPREVLNYRPPVDLTELLGGVTLERLKAIYDDVLKRREDKIDPVRSNFGKIEKEKIQISDTIVSVRKKVRGGRKCSFRSLLGQGASKIRVVVTFLAILELIKTGDIMLTEDSTRDDIIVEFREKEGSDKDDTGSSD